MFRLLGSLLLVLVIVGSYFLANDGFSEGGSPSSVQSPTPHAPSQPADDGMRNLKF